MMNIIINMYSVTDDTFVSPVVVTFIISPLIGMKRYVHVLIS